MKLMDMEIIPGVIVDVNDPEKLGRVKISAPGLFKGNENKDNYGVQNKIDNNVLTWIYPFCMNRYQMFSKELTGAKVWVINNKNNYNEFWYIPMFEYIDVTEEIVKEKYENDIEVVVSRKNGDGASRLYYDRDDGFMMHINDYKFNMQPNGNIFLQGEQANIDIRGGAVYIGKGHQEQKNAVIYDTLAEILGKASSYFGKCTEASKSNPHTAPLAPWFSYLQSTFSKSSTNAIRAKNVFLN